MKAIKISKYIFLAFVLMMTISCDNAKYSAIENGVYILEASPNNRYNQQIENLTIEEEIIQNLTIRLGKYTSQDVEVTLGLDQDFLKSYNTANGTSYEILPDEYLTFDKQVIIEAGETSAPVVSINIKPYKTPNGEAYAIPIYIKSVIGPVGPLGNATRILYLLSAPHMQKAPVLKGGNKDSKVIFSKAIATPNWTVEYWMRMNSTPNGSSNNYVFADNSSPISFNGGTDSHMYLRFWKIGALLQGPCYQCQMVGAYFDDNTEAWQADTWYHIAYTYDGTKVQMYIDGVANANKNVTKNFEFSSIELCGNFNWSNPIAQLAQVRIWNTCLQSSTIKDGMSRQVLVDADGLVGYWKCDEGEGNVLKDSSINGNDLTVKGNIEWSEEYNFSNPNKK